uniref:Uncharacterized protein n=1 Tax=viral metagenome TaxID=1070528 RepID=A0A6C0BMA3_9ZZZZ
MSMNDCVMSWISMISHIVIVMLMDYRVLLVDSSIPPFGRCNYSSA